jgi:hypothetical protein
MVIRTVGLDVGTGRGGMRRPASGGEASVGEATAEAPLADAAARGHGDEASISARGPLLSQAPTQAHARGPTRPTSKSPRGMKGF